ncbi:MAG: hypothetical protein U5K76_07395 [Woeseiaceae bacterium]|nr:hypothetical protein [Woeseiaceae bacterium]
MADSDFGIDLDLAVLKVMNADCQWARADEDPSIIKQCLNNKVLAVPLVDAHGRLVAVALPRPQELNIEGKIISDESPAFVIAEIGNNHNGDFERACRLIDRAAAGGAILRQSFRCGIWLAFIGMREILMMLALYLGAQYTLDLLSRFQLSYENLLCI